MKWFVYALLGLAIGESLAFAPRSCRRSTTTQLQMSKDSSSNRQDRRAFVFSTAKVSAAAVAATFVGGVGGIPAPVEAAVSEAWEKMKIPFKDTLYDIDFDSATHGYVVGAGGAIAETNDGGKTWGARSFSNLDPEGDVTYKFESVSTKDGDVWVLGKPMLLIHSHDNGRSWQRITLSPELSGEPTSILSLGSNKAELTTSSGEIYRTDDAGETWKAQVKESIGATLERINSAGNSTGINSLSGSIDQQVRGDSGSYLAVANHGDFFLTWVGGKNNSWVPHNRGTVRRIRSMGFVQEDIKNGIWMTLNGGKIFICGPLDKEDAVWRNLDFVKAEMKTDGYSIADVAWRNPKEVWAVGDNNVIYVSKDGGKSFSFDDSAKDYSGNLHSVRFFKKYNNGGWALGSNGLLLRHCNCECN